MNSSVGRKAWMVAASIAVVEALKDQGFARWNYTLRSLNQHGKNKIMKYHAQAKKLSAPSSSALSEKLLMAQRRKKVEESHRKIMQLNCWGPECTRF